MESSGVVQAGYIEEPPRVRVAAYTEPDDKISLPPLGENPMPRLKPLPAESAPATAPEFPVSQQEVLPPGRMVLQPGQMVLPLKSTEEVDGAVTAEGDLVSIAVREAPLHAVLSLLAKQQGLSIVASSELTQKITVTLQPTTLDNALDAILAVVNCTWVRKNDVVYVTAVSKEASSNPFFQGREVRVFTLNYVGAADVEKVVTGLLSPVGKVFIRQVDPIDKLKTVEQVVVEDMPPFLERIASYIAQADVMPRQVLIEAHILQVALGRDHAHGINFDALTRLSGAKVQLLSKGFASDTGPGMVFTVDGGDFNSIIDCLCNTTDAKTLASPEVMVVNGQTSKIQIGERLGYFVTTTTQTSTVQDVKYLEVGVVLTVTPQITADGQVLMHVQPKVSTGEINPTTTLPDEQTTEVDTAVLVPDGHGVIIGGLIQEDDIDNQSKLSYLGDLWLVGKLFQRRRVIRERSEVIVALLPRIIDCGACESETEAVKLERATTPLLSHPLHSNYRPWEPRLPSACDPPAWLLGHQAKQPAGYLDYEDYDCGDEVRWPSSIGGELAPSEYPIPE